MRQDGQDEMGKMGMARQDRQDGTGETNGKMSWVRWEWQDGMGETRLVRWEW